MILIKITYHKIKYNMDFYINYQFCNDEESIRISYIYLHHKMLQKNTYIKHSNIINILNLILKYFKRHCYV